MFKVLCAADVHLNISMWNTNKAIKFDSLFSFYSILSIAAEYKCDVILAGDTFDTKQISSELFLYTRAIRNEFPEVAIYYINGNHDPNDPSWLAMLDNTHHLNNQGTSIDGVTVCGLDYVLPNDFEDALKEVYPYAPILITHQTYDCFFKSPIAIDHTLLKDREFTFSGDYHIPGDKQLTEATETTSSHWLSSLGSATRCSIAEHDTGYATIIQSLDSGLDFSRIQLPSRVFLVVKDLIGRYEPDELVTQMPGSPRTRNSMKYCGVNYNRFMKAITEAARSMKRPRPIYTSSLGPVFIARTKEELDYANDAVAELKYGFVLYSPLVTAPTETEDSDVVPQARDTTTAYLQKVAQSYPCDSAVKAALMELLMSSTPDFIEAEARRFGMDNV